MKDATGLVIAVLVCASILSIVAIAIAALELRDRTATNDIRPGQSSFIMSGKVMITVTRTERRYICPGGVERWQ
jgi:hypothetical protein